MIPALFVPKKDDIISNYDLIKQIPLVKITHAECLGKCLCGQYHALLGIMDGKVEAIVIYYVNVDHCKVVGLFAENKLRKYLDLFYDKLKANGIKRVESESKRDQKAYSKFLKMDLLYSVYGRDL